MRGCDFLGTGFVARFDFLIWVCVCLVFGDLGEIQFVALVSCLWGLGFLVSGFAPLVRGLVD